MIKELKKKLTDINNILADDEFGADKKKIGIE